MIQSFVDREQHIWRINQVVAEVKRDHGLTVTDALVSRLLRGRFGMRYKKVQIVAYQGNSDRCILLR